MAFKLGDLIIDRIVEGVGEVASGANAGKLLYRLTNLQEASINVTADSVDAVDGTGAVIKTFYRGKQGEFTATNSTLSLPIIEQMSGTPSKLAEDVTGGIDMPMIITTNKKEGIDLPGLSTSADFAAAKVVVNVVGSNGALGRLVAKFPTEEDPSADSNMTFTAAGSGASNGTLALSGTTNDETIFIIKYNRKVTENGVLIQNNSDKFPTTHKLTLKALIVDPCEPDIVRAAYIVCPSFQPSAEIDFTISTDATLDFSGTLQTSYCAAEKVLYQVYVCGDDEEDAA